MPAIHPALRLVTALTALLFIGSSLSLPQPEAHKSHKKPWKVLSEKRGDLSGVQVPLNNGSMSLPSPEGTLKAVTLGFGTQNYSCKAGSPAPTQVGAKATLFDLSPFLPWVSPFLSQIPGKAVNIQLNTIQSTLATLGTHIFNDLGTPCFHLGQVGELQAVKIPGADLVAPKDAAGTPAGVDWLKLGDKGGSEGINQVYRVETAGGSPPKTCEGQPEDIFVPYAALYWFYES